MSGALMVDWVGKECVFEIYGSDDAAILIGNLEDPTTPREGDDEVPTLRDRA
jgi:hypothetical protein